MVQEKLHAQEQKMNNISVILAWIKHAHAAKKVVSKRKIIAVAQMDLGVTPAKAREYLQLLEDTGKIKTLEFDKDVIEYTPTQEKKFEKEFDEMIGK